MHTQNWIEILYSWCDTHSGPSPCGTAPGRGPGLTGRRDAAPGKGAGGAHVLILPDPAGVMLTDLDSTNGTHVETETGTHRLRPGRTELVRRGYRFYLGDTICTVQ